MKKKITAVIISFFLFSLSVPQACFAVPGLCFEKGKNAEISSKTAQAINLLDISDKIVRKYYGGAKDFFFNTYVKGFENEQIPVYGSKTDEAIFYSAGSAVVNTKKDVYFEKDFLRFKGFMCDRMRGSPFGIHPEITKQYLLSIEALQKGSVPAFAFTMNNIFI
ncbi:MAG: hypothetical protein FWH43_05305 [Endomicrobia bacterium]|nr:hypothetical protein [Endomicrobiia bacterium]